MFPKIEVSGNGSGFWDRPRGGSLRVCLFIVPSGISISSYRCLQVHYLASSLILFTPLYAASRRFSRDNVIRFAPRHAAPRRTPRKKLLSGRVSENSRASRARYQRRARKARGDGRCRGAADGSAAREIKTARAYCVKKNGYARARGGAGAFVFT